MPFKDMILKDLDDTFFSLEEFAERHRIEGVTVAVIVDNDKLNKMKQGQILGMVEADMLILGRTADLPDHLEPGRLLNVDGREMLVASSGEDMGLVELALRQNVTG